MRYTINIDQEFAIINDMTLTEVSCLAACFTLPTWSESYYIENKTWYWYSEDKMLEEFPLLFGVSKRVYKNLKILSDKGFILLSNIGRKKILCFTEKCSEWNRPKTGKKTENGLNETENGLNETENGLNETENGLFPIYKKDNNTIDNNTNYENTNDKEELFPQQLSLPKAKFSKENGLTPGSLNVKQSTIDKIDAFFEQLVFPVDDIELKKLFYVLCCSPKWKGKTIHAIQMSLNKTQNYDKDFIKKLIEDSIAGGWQGLVYPDTDKKYQEYLQRNGQGRSFVSNGVRFTAMSDQEREEMRRFRQELGM